MSERPLCSLKVDVDTHDGMRDGVPRLLEAFARHGVKATFFLSFGPDNAGKAVWNLVRQRGFMRKMLKTGAPKLYGWRTVLSGTLLPARPTAAAMPELVRRIEAEGHEVGVHAWDHRLWQDHLHRLSRPQVEEQVRLACDAFEGILGRRPQAVAAPAWYVSRTSLELHDALGLLYASDMRGGAPAFPELEGYRSTTLQIPTTQPCLEELLTLGQRDPATWVDLVLRPPAEPVDALVLPLHAEVEGGVYASFLDELLERLTGTHDVVPLEGVARRALARDPGVRPATLAPCSGRAGRVFAFEPAGVEV
ncbi:MAG: polysaccharide deacetylase family protein [Planctomycetes bacterium]|nr:polysaccharide deacetylase family protein [Planctomycetota bacterium]